MTSTMDRAGRLVIPKEIRRVAGLQPGHPLEISFRDGRIEIEPAPAKVRLVRRGHLLVAEPQEDLPPLDEDIVQQLIDDVRKRPLR